MEGGGGGSRPIPFYWAIQLDRLVMPVPRLFQCTETPGAKPCTGPQTVAAGLAHLKKEGFPVPPLAGQYGPPRELTDQQSEG